MPLSILSTINRAAVARQFYKAPSGGGGSFTPTSITGLQIWYDATDISSSTVINNQLLSGLKDKSGNNRTANKFGNGTLATYKTSGFNTNYPTISFAGSDLGYATSAFYNVFNADTSTPKGFAWYIVFNNVSSMSFCLMEKSYSNGGAPIDFRDTTRYIADNTGNNAGGGGVLGTGSVNYNNLTSPTIYNFTIDPSGTNLWFREWVNGGNVNTNPNNAVNLYAYSTNYSSVLDNNTSSIFSLCRRQDGNLSFFNGNISEVVIYNSIASTQTRQKIEGYLAWKWGLTGSLPNSHPYKTVQPS